MRRVLTAVLALAVSLVPGATGAQSCGVNQAVSATAGYVFYDVGGGTGGVGLGVDAAARAGPAHVRVAYRKALLASDGADPDLVRGLVAVPAVAGAGIQLCAVGHVGLTRFALEDDTGIVLAGGLGLTVATDRLGAVEPYVSVRGLGARIGGTVLGQNVSAGGLATGIEAGAAMDVGPVQLRLTGSVDGFDDGLGVTPYPAVALEIALGYRF